MSREDNTQIYEMLSVFFMTVSKGQHILQCLKEVLTSHPLFNPLGLFKYISKSSHYITHQQLLAFLVENNSAATQEDIKLLILMEGGIQCWQYTNFLDFIYPHNSAILRQIAANNVKNYSELEKYCVDEEIITTFYLLLSEEISYIHKLEHQKSDSLLKIPKQKIRKVIKSIKKAGQKLPNHCENSQDVITSLELRNFMKAFINIQDTQFLHLSRKLGMNKGVFSIQKIEAFLKQWRRTKKTDQVKNTVEKHSQSSQNNQSNSEQKKSNKFHNDMIWEQDITKKKENKTPLKEFDQKQYRQQLYKQLSNTLNLDNRAKEITSTNKMRQSQKKKQSLLRKNQPEHEVALKLFPQEEKIKPLNNKKTNEGPKQLFKQFIELFLSFSKNNETLKAKLSKYQIDYLKLFKKIDQKQRGVICSQDLFDFYCSLGGSKCSIQHFSLLIKSFALSQENWLSYSEFCEIFRPDSKQNQDFLLGSDFDEGRNGENALKTGNKLMVDILDETIENQRSLLSVRSQFKKHESKFLFNLINKEQNGFINYQELKNYLAKECGMSLLMHQLMIVLKKLDRSKNGVVVQNQFVTYFYPELEQSRQTLRV